MLSRFLFVTRKIKRYEKLRYFDIINSRSFEVHNLKNGTMNFVLIE